MRGFFANVTYLDKRVFSITFAFISSKSLTPVFVYHFLISEYRQTFFGTPVFVGGGGLSLPPPSPHPPLSLHSVCLSRCLLSAFICACVEVWIDWSVCVLVIEATSFLPPPRSIDHSHYSAATAPGHQPPLVLPYLRRALVATDGLGLSLIHI